MSSRLDAALRYAGCGWHVFPVHTPVPGFGMCSCGKADCPNAGKHPRTKNGVLDATLDGGVIHRWLVAWPDANIGIATGATSGLVVIDIDGEEGAESLLALQRQHGQLPNTVEQLTGGGGRHLLFKHPGKPIKNGTGLRPGLDIRADGGYIVAPPSVHESGRAYAWEVSSHPDEVPVAALPDAWVRFVTDNQRKPSAPVPERIPAGERNATLASVAGSLRRPGLSQEAITEALLVENRSRCDPPLPDDEVRAIAASVSRYAPVPLAPSTPLVQAAPSPTWDEPSWPAAPDRAAYHGFAGRLVHTIEPYTEGDPVAVLGQFLTAFGCAVGSSPHQLVGATRHTPRLFTVIVGKTSRGRKGDSYRPVATVFRLAHPGILDRFTSGIGSGEAVIWAVRDPTFKREAVKDKAGNLLGHEEVEVDPGEPDKRLLITEHEMSRLLKVMSRQGNVTSSVLREAWDGPEVLRITTKNSPARATDAHVTLIGHITIDELRAELPDLEGANGYGNRHLWLLTQRSKLLPDPEPFTDQVAGELATELSTILSRAQAIDRMHRDRAANDMWQAVYSQLSKDVEGLAGAMTARAEAIVLRLSLLYALLDCSAVVSPAHLEAALALWRYAEASVLYIFGSATGDPVADDIMAAAAGSGELTRTQIRDLFGRHVATKRIEYSLQKLATKGRLVMATRETGGRPVEVWRPAPIG